MDLEQAKIVCRIEQQKEIARRTGMEEWLKYLDEDQFLEEKLEIFKILGLDKKTNQRVLDVGAGLGHFGSLCKAHGHSYLGTYFGRTSQHLHPFFVDSDLNHVECGLFPRYGKDIPLGPWDAIIMLRTTFEINLEWTADDWVELYNTCMENLNPGGQLLIKSNLTGNPTKKYGQLEYDCVNKMKIAFKNYEPLPQWQWLTYHFIKD